MNREQLTSNLLSSKHWLRLVFMVLFALALQLASLVMWAVVVLQFLFSLITGQDNANLRRLGKSLARYIHDVLVFVTYNGDDKPFPFADWPSAEQNLPEPPKSRARATSHATKRTRSSRAKPKASDTSAPDAATKGDPDSAPKA